MSWRDTFETLWARLSATAATTAAAMPEAERRWWRAAAGPHHEEIVTGAAHALKEDLRAGFGVRLPRAGPLEDLRERLTLRREEEIDW